MWGSAPIANSAKTELREEFKDGEGDASVRVGTLLVRSRVVLEAEEGIRVSLADLSGSLSGRKKDATFIMDGRERGI